MISHCDKPLSEAVDLLTIGEIGRAERHFKRDMENFSGMQQLCAVIFSLEKRNNREFTWEALDEVTFRQAQDYFEPEPADFDPSDPDSESGKGESAPA